jgi:hypothetical protein
MSMDADGDDADGLDVTVICATCGTALDGQDQEEDPTGDGGQPICGNCARERDFFDIGVALEEAEG